MDVFVEQMIKRKLSAKDYLIAVGIAIVAIILVFLCLTVFAKIIGTLFVLIIGGIIYIAYKLIRMRLLEFEYSFTNGDLTVDKIIDRSRRKRVISFDVKDVEEIGKYTLENQKTLLAKNTKMKLFAGKNASGVSEDSWYILCNSNRHGYFLLVFDPQEKVLEAIKKFLPVPVRVKCFEKK